jgi:glycosyltransferase involved in cell wall biosynthesis
MNDFAAAQGRRLAFVVDTGENMDDPGVGRFYRGLVGGLGAAGFDVTPLGLEVAGSQQLEELTERLEHSPVRTPHGPAALRQTAGDVRDLLRWSLNRLEAGPFDVVLEFQYNGRFAGWRIAHRDKAAHLVFVDQIESIIPPRRSGAGPALRRLERRRYRECDAVAFRTAALARAYIERWGEPRRWATSHMAVDPVEFSPSPERRARVRSTLGARDDDVVVGVVAFFAPYHRGELVGPLVRALRSEGVRARGVLVGGWANASAELLQRCRARAPEEWEHVTVVGAVPQHEVPGFIDAFDVGVMPGSNWYGSPTKVIEYGAMGTPVVAPRTDPIEEVVTSGSEALLFETEAELLSAVLDVLERPEAAAERASTFRSRVLREHTWDHRGRELADLVS